MNESQAGGKGKEKKKEGASAKIPTKKENFHLFLLAGQSNMMGVASVESEDKKSVPRVLFLNKAGEWVPAVDPIHECPGSGVCLGRTFAIELAKSDPSITVGLIPCAVGGTDIGNWLDKNQKYYSAAVTRTLLAMESGTLKAILWHQGEGDCYTKELSKSYGDKLEKLVNNFRSDFKLPNLPFIVGGLNPNLPRPAVKELNAALKDVPDKISKTAYVSIEGLKDTGDKTHFDAASTRELGERYLDAYLSMQKNTKRKK
jgi:hypothetical protein